MSGRETSAGVAHGDEFLLDLRRDERIGLEEAIYCAGKSPEQITAILQSASERDVRSLLLTRLDREKVEALPAALRDRLDYCSVSRTAVLGVPRTPGKIASVAIVCAGTSDVPVAREAERTLAYNGEATGFIADVGVAGLWRLLQRLDEIRSFPIVIAAAGMDAALPSVLGGLVGGSIIAVPTSVGYGVAGGGRAALDALLASCSPGLTVVNIDNGYGAACAAIRLLNAARRMAGGSQGEFAP